MTKTPTMKTPTEVNESADPFRQVRCDVFRPLCPAGKVLNVLADKWTLLILHALSEYPHRPGELRRRLIGISEKVLIQSLRRLEKYKLVIRTDFNEKPLRVEYTLTEFGRSLGVVIRSLDTWVEDNAIELTKWDN